MTDQKKSDVTTLPANVRLITRGYIPGSNTWKFTDDEPSAAPETFPNIRSSVIWPEPDTTKQK